jgi:hypothetical protein
MRRESSLCSEVQRQTPQPLRKGINRAPKGLPQSLKHVEGARSALLPAAGRRLRVGGAEPTGQDVWVPNWPSTAVICGIAGWWRSGMIAGRGGKACHPLDPKGES